MSWREDGTVVTAGARQCLVEHRNSANSYVDLYIFLVYFYLIVVQTRLEQVACNIGYLW